ncbi:MAG: NAD(P)H-dependent oxidoreductase [Lentisphaeria bacterium]|nr:NAD(P)H-dependent oxidoreductase [Lentisphaeria bacterium]
MGIHIVRHIPEKDTTYARNLLMHAQNSLIGSLVDDLDLLDEQPPLFNYESYQAYQKRNYFYDGLSLDEHQVLEPFDRYAKRLEASHLIIVSISLQNLMLPGAFSCWLNASLMRGIAWNTNNEKVESFLKNKKILIILGAIQEELEFARLQVEMLNSMLSSLKPQALEIILTSEPSISKDQDLVASFIKKWEQVL